MGKKILLVIIGVAVIGVLASMLGQISTDMEQDKAFADVAYCGHGLDMDGLDLRVTICMENLGNVEAVLNRADVRFYAGDSEIGTVDLSYDVQIAPGEVAWVDVDLMSSGLEGAISEVGADDLIVYYCAYYDSPAGPFESCST